MGATDSKTTSQYSQKSVAQVGLGKSNAKLKPQTRKHLTQNLESKLSSTADDFTPSGIHVLTEPAKYGKYSEQKDAPWMQFLVRKDRERQGRSPGQMQSATPKQPVILHTAEYLKLLKSAERPNRTKLKQKGADQVGGTVKTDISVAVDEIIQSRCKNAKSVNTISKDEALLSIVKFFESKAPTPEVGSAKAEIAAASKPENIVDAQTQDDIMLEKLNRDEDLADPAYWSEDERAPKSLRLASAHRLGRRPQHDPAILHEYVMQDLDSQLDTEVAKVLHNANLLGARHKSFETSQVKYIVSGLKEVCRSLKYGKVKCVFIAPDIEDCTSNQFVGDRVRDILAMAYERDVPVVFALSRSRFGLAFGKSLNMSAIGLLETKGMKDQYNKMLSSAYQQRESWMERELPR